MEKVPISSMLCGTFTWVGKMLDVRKVSKKWKLASLIIFPTLIGFFLGWDCVVANNPFRADTASEGGIWSVLRSLTLAAAGGILLGHLTWPAKARNTLKIVLICLGSIAVFMLVWDVLIWTKVVQWKWLLFIKAWPPITILCFYPVGRLCWPQERR